MSLRIAPLDPQRPSWPVDVDRLRQELGAPDNPTLFPPHYLKRTLPSIGGHVLRIEDNGRLLGGAFLFPRQLTAQGRVYTLRFHRADPGAAPDQEQLVHQVGQWLHAAVVFYDPLSQQPYHPTSRAVDGLDIGHPDALEARAVRGLQQAIWRSEPDYLYPVDIHSAPFQAGLPLVARMEKQVVGFLFGFFMFDGPPVPSNWPWRTNFRLESQILGVAPDYRGRGIGTALKVEQARLALATGIELVHWTVDPLLFGNAVLNIGRLRAVSYIFYEDYYPFTNELNRVRTSRLRIVWPVASQRVRAILSLKARATLLDLSQERDIRRVNRGWIKYSLEEDADRIAFEIPANWTGMQRDDPDEARRWREVTDRLFRRYLGLQPDRYLITDVGVDGERCYLVASRATPAFLERLAA